MLDTEAAMPDYGPPPNHGHQPDHGRPWPTTMFVVMRRPKPSPEAFLAYGKPPPVGFLAYAPNPKRLFWVRE
jgi:hypothetical protein